MAQSLDGYMDLMDRAGTIRLNVQAILVEIGLEVERAKQEWGEDFDLRNSRDNWITYVVKYLGKAADMSATTEQQETNLRKAAGILVSAIDMLQRNGFSPLHYDGQTRPASLPEIK